ncbi:calcium-binding protein [Nonomuraea zeae]|uniref:Calcium-binding protein n=1 Tax=Nonomuraea zeae TaxID=1642303 RepID=A0A5S4GJK7_9ACTN|nr:calcium-binding protein [Nonomuraea zeae]TMR33049.1 calcium-binding protein [Nonomuraea zeae]
MFRGDRRRGALRVLGGAAVLAALPAVLSVQTAMAAPCYGDCQPGVVRSAGVLKYDAPVGVADQITVSAGGGFLTVTDPAATLTVGAGCTLVTPHEARCSSANVGSMVIRGLDGDDVITNSTGLAARLMGGNGADRLAGGSGGDTLIGGFGGDLLQGGGGPDTAVYSEVSNRLGVRADLDGVTGDDGSSEDGPAGARDTVAADVENLEGTRANDVLIGNAGANVIDGSGGHDQVQGLGGDDRLTGEGGGSLDGGAGTDHCTSDLRLVPGQADAFAGCETTAVLTP